MAEHRSPDISHENGVTIVALGADYESLEEPTLDDVKEVLLEIAKTAEPPRVVLDLSHTKFFGSAFIEVLFRVWNRLNGRKGGAFAISGLTPHCRDVIEVTHLDRLWHIFPTREDAVRALGQS